MKDDVTPGAGGFDFEMWLEELLGLNPWARGLTIDETNAEFIAARRKATLARYAEGRAAWNAWAIAMLEQKKGLEAAGLFAHHETGDTWFGFARSEFSTKAAPYRFEGHVSFDKFLFIGVTAFDNATFSGDASFLGANFSAYASFQGATFAGLAYFRSVAIAGVNFGDATFFGIAAFDEATFESAAAFDRAAFSTNAQFSDATFAGAVQFGSTTFAGPTWFTRATFTKAAWFGHAAFSGTTMFEGAKFKADVRLPDVRFNDAVDFARVRFEGLATFEGSHFRGGANFEWIDSTTAFSLAGAAFGQVPSFFGATFKGVLRLDNVKTPRYGWLGYTPDRDARPRFRELRRRAVEAQDRGRELEFFAQEFRTGRFHSKHLPGWLPKVWNLGFWFGLAFEAFSNFGRSLWRPLFCWLALLLVFAIFYLGEHEDMRKQREALGPGGAWDTAITYFETTRSALSDPPACRAQGRGAFSATDAVTEAFNLSLATAMVFEGGRSNASRRTFGCLYGFETAGDQEYPIVSSRVSRASTLQSLASAVLIFLFLLGVRNQLRLK